MTSPAPTQRILVVDDDKEIVRLVRAYLEQVGYQVLTANDGEGALHSMRHDSPTLAVLDVMMPNRDGWEVTRIARSDPALRAIPIILLTARIEDTDKIVGLELGADDYITKPFNPREVVARVRAVLRRTINTAEAPQQRVFFMDGLTLDLDKHTTTLHDKTIDLTPTEFKILHLLMSHPGHAFTRAEIAERVIGYDSDIVERTLDTHIKNLRRKIEPDGKEQHYVQTVYGVGYRFTGKQA
jgi:two-component system alkaline phosphatase synthesis response regulator PhoP